MSNGIGFNPYKLAEAITKHDKSSTVQGLLDRMASQQVGLVKNKMYDNLTQQLQRKDNQYRDEQEKRKKRWYNKVLKYLSPFDPTGISKGLQKGLETRDLRKSTEKLGVSEGFKESLKGTFLEDTLASYSGDVDKAIKDLKDSELESFAAGMGTDLIGKLTGGGRTKFTDIFGKGSITEGLRDKFSIKNIKDRYTLDKDVLTKKLNLKDIAEGELEGKLGIMPLDFYKNEDAFNKSIKELTDQGLSEIDAIEVLKSKAGDKNFFKRDLAHRGLAFKEGMEKGIWGDLKKVFKNIKNRGDINLKDLTSEDLTKGLESSENYTSLIDFLRGFEGSSKKQKQLLKFLQDQGLITGSDKLSVEGDWTDYFPRRP